MLDRVRDAGLETREETGRVTALPASSQEVATLVRLAAGEGWLVAPSWMELNAGSRAVVYVSPERMCGIGDVAPADLMAVVGAGASVSAFSEAAAEHGLCWPVAELVPPDDSIGDVFARLPGSWTLPGSLARRYLLTVDAVMADAALLKAGARTVKSVTGYDLRQLLVGSRGTLGVITGLTLRLEARANLEMVMRRYRSDFSGLGAETDAAVEPDTGEDGSYFILQKLKGELDPGSVFPSVDQAFAVKAVA